MTIERGCDQSRFDAGCKKLNDLYQQLLSEIDSDDDRRQCVNLMHWMCFGRKSFSLAELRHALCLQPDTTFSSLDELKSHPFYVDNDEDMKIRTITLSCGLVEIQNHKTTTDTAVFIHESVKDFVENEGLRLLQRLPPLNDRLLAAQADVRLSWCSIRYLDAFVLNRAAVDLATQKNTFPLTRYALASWIFCSPDVVPGDGTIVNEQYKIFTYMGHPREGPNRLQKWYAWARLYQASFGFHDTQTYPPCPFQLAVVGKHYEVASMLTADCYALSGSPILHWAIDAYKFFPSFAPYLLNNKPEYINKQDDNGRTPLMIAIQAKLLVLIRMLLDSETLDVDGQGREGLTALHYAVENGPEILGMLLRHKSINVNLPDFHGITALHQSISENKTKTTKLLLGFKDIDVNAPTKYGCTPLHVAIFENNSESVELLLRHKSIAHDIPSFKGTRALHQSVSGNKTKSTGLLLGFKDIDVNARSSYGRTPLFYTIKQNNSKLVELLLEHKYIDLLDVYTQDGIIYSALALALKYPGVSREIINMVKQKYQEQSLYQREIQNYEKNKQNKFLDLVRTFTPGGWKYD